MTRKQRPKTGEARKTRQPFAIDKLPSEWRDRIMSLRAKLMTWEQLEEETRTFDWAKLEQSDPELALSHFADKRIPATTLRRWYDVQVEQKGEVVAERRRASLAIAQMFAANGYENLDETVKNALADVVIGYVKDSSEPEKLRAALSDLALTLTRFKRTEIAKERVTLDREKLQSLSAKVRGLKDDVAKKKVSPEELAKKLDEIYDITRPNA